MAAACRLRLSVCRCRFPVDGLGIYVIYRDITERKRAEVVLRAACGSIAGPFRAAWSKSRRRNDVT